MKEFSNFITFNIFNIEVNLLSIETDWYGINTIAEIDNIYYQMGDAAVNILTAIKAYEWINECTLSKEEIKEIVDAY